MLCMISLKSVITKRKYGMVLVTHGTMLTYPPPHIVLCQSVITKRK
jgi:hypothetical protein